ncbi:hypothetical protein AKJ51_03955 [candidate division MSBL1 archaeon SCGC-AAA382A20]|uniref:CARDB domain-containing protein n=1 Tax=candidate division MSBL1 archaeon SCGC-AAA382A20 TaxID=1698280 RepID=A0A133VIM3_9EURY|nr:hypothetical protein AKJ51_03955 [candidate division MSBL1 archaeon SCGC-AAA382A20]
MKNTGEARRSKTVKLRIDGGIADRRTVALSPGESTTVKFSISREVVGTYEVSVGEMSESFKVKRAIEPAKFEVTDLILGKEEVNPGETTTIEVEVKNTGGKEGTYTVELSINGEIKTRSVSLGPGVYRMVPFKISIPVGNLPGWGLAISHISPLTYLTDLTRWTFGSEGGFWPSPFHDVLILVGFLVGFFALSVFLHRRTLPGRL